MCLQPHGGVLVLVLHFPPLLGSTFGAVVCALLLALTIGVLPNMATCRASVAVHLRPEESFPEFRKEYCLGVQPATQHDVAPDQVDDEQHQRQVATERPH
jgi:hypothetical protein